MPTPLLLTRFFLPGPARGLVARERLFQALDRGRAPAHRLTVLSAPPGYGKTTLVGSWLRRLGPGTLAAWLSLEPGDNDPARFWAHVVAAVRAALERAAAPGGADFGEDALNLLQSPGQPGDETFLIVLLNALAALEAGLFLVLDDLHLVEEPAIHKGLEFLVERLPAGCHAVFLTRTAAPFPVHLLRGRGQLLELRQDDLSFQDDEAARFLVDGLGLELTGADVHLLNRKAEGWASGLQMAAVSLQGRPDPGPFIRAFSGAHRFVQDYLTGEVLERQAPHVREFLLRTSILDTLTAPLCDALLAVEPVEPQAPAPPSARQTLADLEAANLFILPLDEERSAYRYHALFAALLRARLDETHPGLSGPLHRRAGEWLESHGLPEQAVQHHLAAGEYPRAAALIARAAGPLWNRGEHATLLRLLSALPEDVRAANPELLVYQAGVWVSAGRFQEAESCLEKVDARLEAGSDPAEHARLAGRIAVVRALIAGFRGDPQAALEYARRAAEAQPAGPSIWTVYAGYTAGNVLMVAGQFAEARREFETALRLGRELDSPLVYLNAAAQLFKLDWSQGRMDAAGEITHAAVAYIQAHNLEDTPLAAEIQVHQAFVLMEQGYLAEAEAVIRRSLHAAQPGEDYPALANIYLVLMACQTVRRDWEGAEQTYRQASEILRRHEIPIWTESGLAGSIANLWARQGRLGKAEEFLRRRGITPAGAVGYPHQGEYVALAFILLRQGRLEQAAGVIRRLMEYVEATAQWAGMVPILYLQADLYRQQGHETEALNTLASALELAETYGQIQAFFLLEDELLPLINQAIRRWGASPALERLVASLTAPSEPAPASAPAAPAAGSGLIEPLSTRELEVLELLAAGLTNQEIANRLYLALPTVKYHTGNIFSKLGVKNRTQAVTAARAAGLIG